MAVVLAAGMPWGCGDSDEEAIRAGEIAEGCALDSDCRPQIICVFARCHVQCRSDVDCDEGEQRCVAGSTPGVNVCQLDVETECQRDYDCQRGLVCGIDGECRNRCRVNDDCIGDQICANSGECASADPKKDKLDGENNILPDPYGPTGGYGGVGGASGTGGSSGGSDAGASGGTGGGGMSGAGGSGGTADASAGRGGTGGTGDAAGGSGGSGGGPGDASGGSAGGDAGGYHETPDGLEKGNNNDPDHPVPLTSIASIYLPVGDQDWFSVTVPDTGGAQVIELTLDQAPGQRVGVQALSGALHSPIGNQVADVGEITSVYVSAGPGSTTLFGFSLSVSSLPGLRADLSLRVTPENDAHEPNNSFAAAAEIQPNAIVSAQFMHPFTSATDQTPDDWYAIQLNAGPAVFELLNTPAAGRFLIERVNGSNVPTPITTTSAGMVNASYPMTIPETGTYYIHFAEALQTVGPFAMGPKPPYMAEQYTFRVRQGI